MVKNDGKKIVNPRKCEAFSANATAAYLGTCVERAVATAWLAAPAAGQDGERAMTNDPPIAEQWHAALDGRERSEAPVYVPPERRPPLAGERREGVFISTQHDSKAISGPQSRAALLACVGVQGEAMRPEMDAGG